MTDMSSQHPTPVSVFCHNNSLLAQSSFFREIVAERDEIMRHKWIESEKAGWDIGFNQALVSWMVHHRANWRMARQKSAANIPGMAAN